MNGLLTNIGIDIAGKCGVAPSSLLKNAAVLHEYVFFHSGLYGGLGDSLNFTNAELAASWASMDRDVASQLATNHSFVSLFPDVRELSASFSDFNPFRASEYSRRLAESKHSLSVTRTIVSRTYGVTEEEVEAGRIGNTWSNIPQIVAQDAALLAEVRRYDPSIMGVFSEAHATLLEIENDHRRPEQQTEELTILLGRSQETSSFPDFSEFSWDEIIELRRDPHISAFRAEMTRLVSGLSPWSDEKMVLGEHYLRTLEELSKQVKPSVSKSIISLLIGQIPTGPFPNPLSLIGEILELRHQAKLTDNYGWLYFVQKAKSISDRRRPKRSSGTADSK